MNPFRIKNPEQNLVRELQATVTGDELPSKVFMRGVAPGQNLAIHLTGGTSGNWWLIAFAIAYYRQVDGVRERILEFFAASRSCWMGEELLSIIYGLWGHLLPVAAIYMAAMRDKDAEVAGAALEWMKFWFRVQSRCLAPDGATILTVGARSGGHRQIVPTLPIPDAVWVCYIFAAATGAGTARWLSAAKTLNLAPNKDPIKIISDALLSALHDGAQVTNGPLPPFRTITPIHCLRGEFAEAVWMESSPSSLTPSLMAAGWDRTAGGVPIYLPERGGAHFRKSADHAVCGKTSNLLLYQSSIVGQENQAMVLTDRLDGIERLIGVP